jgi:hypothetical protein
MSDLVVAQQMPQARIHCLQRFACWEVLARGHVSCMQMDAASYNARAYALCRLSRRVALVRRGRGRDLGIQLRERRGRALRGFFARPAQHPRVCVLGVAAWVRQRECVLHAIAASSSLAASSHTVVGLGRLLSTVIQKVN